MQDEEVQNGIEIQGQNDRVIAWSAPEYIHSQKTGFWIVTVILIAFILLAISVYFQSWTFTILIGVAIFAGIVHLKSEPRNINYSLSGDSLKINDHNYDLANFKAFGIQNNAEHKVFSIILVPQKRFSGNVILFFPESLGEDIVDLLGTVLPIEDISPDILDRVLGLLRF
ncbi:MAG: hypothetical protein LBM97_01825 [Candidatus Nomurabacteria bacterium]|jgi:hypothetical protein|nr:hypothetical protein [Candidatus Nomurabacteria bacterium]